MKSNDFDADGAAVRGSTRRQFLAATGAVATAGLAGCSGDGGSDNEGSGDSAGDGGSGDGASDGGSGEAGSGGSDSGSGSGNDDASGDGDASGDDVGSSDASDGADGTGGDGESDESESDGSDEPDPTEIDPAYDGWPMFRRDAGDTGYAPDHSLPDGGVEAQWRVGELDEGNANGRPPVVGDGLVFGGGKADGLVALNAANGAEVWRADVGGEFRVRSPAPAVVDGTVYVATTDGEVVAFDARNGDEQWRYGGLGSDGNVLKVADGTVFVRESGRNPNTVFHAIDAASGDGVWTHEPEELLTMTTEPVVADGTVYLGGVHGSQLTGFVQALDPGSGEVRWTATFDREVDNMCAIDGAVYAATRHFPDAGGAPGGVLYGVDGAAGDEVWSYDVGGSMSLLADEDSVYAVPTDGTVTAIDRANGAEQWAQDVGVEGPERELVADGTLVLSGAGTVIGLDAESGTESMAIDIPEPDLHSLALANGTVFLSGSEYAVAAYGP